MNPNAEGRFFVIDMETWGFHYLDDPVLEVGLSVRDLYLKEEDYFHQLIWDDPWYGMLEEQHKEKDSVVYNMHSSSGLLKEAFESGVESIEAASNMMSWLDAHDVQPDKDYLVGSSVHFDSTMLFFNFPDIRARFHHRVIDVSSMKVMTELWYPNTAAALKKETQPQRKHRVLPDIEDTVEELKWYLENVLPEGDEPVA